MKINWKKKKMTKDQFISYVKGIIDGEMINHQSGLLSPPLKLIKTALENIDAYDGEYRISINNEVPDMVPYHTVCSCNSGNGGSGICGCVMGNKMIPNPAKYPSTVGSTTTLNPDIKLGPRIKPPFTNLEPFYSVPQSAIDEMREYMEKTPEGQVQTALDKIREAGYDITYQNYVKTVTKNRVVEEMEYPGDCEYRFVTGTVLEDIGGKYDLYAIPFTKEQFIERIKTDKEFAKRWIV